MQLSCNHDPFYLIRKDDLIKNRRETVCFIFTHDQKSRGQKERKKENKGRLKKREREERVKNEKERREGN